MSFVCLLFSACFAGVVIDAYYFLSLFIAVIYLIVVFVRLTVVVGFGFV